MKKKRSLRNVKLKANRKLKLRIRRENKKTENHKKQRLATLKRLKRVMTTMSWRETKTGEGGRYQTAQVGHGDG